MCFSFASKNRNSCCWNQHLFTTRFWTDSDFSMFDLWSTCFAGLVWVLWTFWNDEITTGMLMWFWFECLLHFNWSEMLFLVFDNFIWLPLILFWSTYWSFNPDATHCLRISNILLIIDILSYITLSMIENAKRL
jgi:hypothetical protein